MKTFTADDNGARAPVILVGTHSDQVDDNEIKNKFQTARKIFEMESVACISINNAAPMDIAKTQNDDPEDLKALRKHVLYCGLGICDEQVPARWIDLQCKVDHLRQDGTRVMSFKDIQDLNSAMDFPLQYPESIENFLDHLHCRGQILFYPEKTADNIILLDPSILVDFLNSILRTTGQCAASKAIAVEDPGNKNGIVSEEYMIKATDSVISSNTSLLSKCLIQMLIRLKIIYAYIAENDNRQLYILPSLLPDHEEESTVPSIETGPKLKITFKVSGIDAPIPVGFYQHLLVTVLTDINDISVLNLENIPQIFKTFATFEYVYEDVLVDIYWKNSAIFIHVNNYGHDVKLASVTLNTFIENLEKAVQTTADIYRQSRIKYDLCIECPEHQDCYVSVNKLREKGKDRCKKRHFLTDEVLLEPPVRTLSETGHELTVSDIGQQRHVQINVV